MRTLTSTLLAAQRSASAKPYVEAVFDDYDGYARRARFRQHYSGGEDGWFPPPVSPERFAAPGASRGQGRDPVCLSCRFSVPGPASTRGPRSIPTLATWLA